MNKRPPPARPELASELDNLNFEFDALEQHAHECARLTPVTPVAIREFIHRLKFNLRGLRHRLRAVETSLNEQEKRND